MPRPMAKAPLPDEVASWLTQRIQGGALAAGAMLPSERQLTERFAVSRAVVREALAQLKSDGLVTAYQGKGAFVAGANRHSFRIRDVALAEKADLAHILELLITIEVAATQLAAARRTPAELERIRQALLGMERAIAQHRLGDEEDYEFHRAIVEAAHNPHFKALNEYLENSVRKLIRQARSNTVKRFAAQVQAVQDEHQSIYDAIAAGNPDLAAAAAEAHLRNAARRLDAYLETSPRRRRKVK